MPSCGDRTADPGSSRVRTPRAGRARRAAGVALLAAGAGLLAATLFARPLDRDVDARSVRVAENAAGAPEPGLPDGEGPFAFAVVGPVRGDDAALARALELVPAGAPVVLLGDVLGGAPESDARRIAAVLAGTRDVVAVPGPRDLAALDAFQAHVCAADWFFVHHEHLFVGGSPDRLPRRAHAGTFRFTTTSGDGFAPPPAGDGELGVCVVTVSAEGERSRADHTVRRGMGAASLVRSLQLDVLGPATRTTGGYVAILALCAGLLFAGERLAFAAGSPATK